MGVEAAQSSCRRLAGMGLSGEEQERVEGAKLHGVAGQFDQAGGDGRGCERWNDTVEQGSIPDAGSVGLLGADRSGLLGADRGGLLGACSCTLGAGAPGRRPPCTTMARM